MGERGTYMYGIIRSELPRQGSMPPYPKGLRIVGFRDIAAVVADAEIVDLKALSREALAHFLLAHQQMIETIMGNDVTIIPMRLGTFAANEGEACAVLEKGYETIMKVFENIDGKVEDDVVAVWTDPGVILQAIAQEPDIAAMRQDLLAKKEGITVDDQVRMGFLVKKRFDEKKKQYAREIVDVLKDVSQGQREHDCLDDSMIVNEAFLVNRCGTAGFMERLEGLGKRFDALINFRCVGPLPAYSFATLEVKKINCNEIVWAKNRLGIGDFATGDDIKTAYRNQAVICHPDRHADGPGGNGDFQDVNRAYGILNQCCHDNLFCFGGWGTGNRADEIVVQVRE